MRELGIDLSDRARGGSTARARRTGRRRRHDGLRRRLPVHPRQAIHRLGPPDPKGRPLDEVRATRDEIAQPRRGAHRRARRRRAHDPRTRLRLMTQDTRRPFIVVGIDGSACSRGALRWAAHRADSQAPSCKRSCPWSLPEIYAYESRDFEGETREALRSAVEETLGEEPPVAVTERVVEGHAAQALVAASRGAELAACRRLPRAVGASRACCWARSASAASLTRPAPSWSSGRRTTAEGGRCG